MNRASTYTLYRYSRLIRLRFFYLYIYNYITLSMSHERETFRAREWRLWCRFDIHPHRHTSDYTFLTQSKYSVLYAYYICMNYSLIFIPGIFAWLILFRINVASSSSSTARERNFLYSRKYWFIYMRSSRKLFTSRFSSAKKKSRARKTIIALTRCLSARSHVRRRRGERKKLLQYPHGKDGVVSPSSLSRLRNYLRERLFFSFFARLRMF